MGERFGRRTTKGGKATALPRATLEKVRGLFGRQKTRRARRNITPAVGLGVFGGAVAAAILLLLLLRRRAARQDSPTEEANEESTG